MPRTRIKICGITRVEDAITAAQAGAYAIVLNFYPKSPRYISIDRAREILDKLPPFVTPIALFVNADANTIRATCAALGIHHVQLHGEEPSAVISELAEFNLIKVFRVAASSRDDFTPLDRFQAELELVWKLYTVNAFLLDTASDVPGGSGRENNWDIIQTAKEKGLFKGLPPIIAAGGLRPETVAEVVRRLRPYAVDVSSGVEEKPGEKSPAKIRAFIDAVRLADAS